MTWTSPGGRRRGRLITAALLSGGLLVSACSSGGGEDDPAGSAGSPPAADSAGSAPPAAGSEPNDEGVQRVLDSLGSVLRTSLPNVESYDVDEASTTLVVRFSSGSTDETYAHCLISRSAAQGLGLPEDYRLVMAYPDGEKECASS